MWLGRSAARGTSAARGGLVCAAVDVHGDPADTPHAPGADRGRDPDRVPGAARNRPDRHEPQRSAPPDEEAMTVEEDRRTDWIAQNPPAPPHPPDPAPHH